MLIRFRVQNFLSFRDEIEFSMVAGKVQKHPDQIVRDSNKINVDLLRAAIIYGANASGKSNLVKAIAFAKFMVVEGIKPKALIPRKYFKLDPDCLNQPSRFELELQYDNKVYIYGFCLDSKRVHEEWLLEIHANSEKLLFKRSTTPDKSNTFELGLRINEKDKTFVEFMARGTPVNKLFLLECKDREIKYFSDVYEWFENLVIIYPNSFHSLAPIRFSDKTEFGELLISNLRHFDTGVCGYALSPVNNPLEEIPKELFASLEQSLPEGKSSVVIDSNGQRYFIEKHNEQLKVNKLFLNHLEENCSSDELFAMSEESDGTLRLLDLIPVLNPVKTEKNQVVIIDELDRSLHPSISYEFISTFLRILKQRQIIVTTHESNLLDLDLVRRDEIWFVEKDQSGSSSVYSLEEFAPRYDKDIRKGYMLGRFGAIPVLGRPDFTQESE